MQYIGLHLCIMFWKIPKKTSTPNDEISFVKRQTMSRLSLFCANKLIFIWKWSEKWDFFSSSHGLRERHHEPADTRGNKNNDYALYFDARRNLLCFIPVSKCCTGPTYFIRSINGKKNDEMPWIQINLIINQFQFVTQLEFVINCNHKTKRRNRSMTVCIEKSSVSTSNIGQYAADIRSNAIAYKIKRNNVEEPVYFTFGCRFSSNESVAFRRFNSCALS